MPVYLVYLTVFFTVPVLVLWSLYWKLLLKYKKTFLLTIIPTFIAGVPWDLLSVRSGLWHYDTAPTLGIWFFGKPSQGLPLEELFFTFICPVLITTLVILGRKYFQTYVR